MSAGLVSTVPGFVPHCGYQYRDIVPEGQVEVISVTLP